MTREEVKVVMDEADSWTIGQLLEDDYAACYLGPSGPILLTRDTRRDPLNPSGWWPYEGLE